VDDEAIIIEVGTEILQELGYHLMVARSGEEAVELYSANKGRIDIVVLDMIMPGMGGGETFDRLKAIDPHVKVLLSSGYSVKGEASDILARGCQGFIQKPFNIAALSEKLREILDDPSAQEEDPST
jgi:two-component system cell cycle sensor histidine kinase/response regulator CckA